jgi:poly(A) polymerase
MCHTQVRSKSSTILILRHISRDDFFGSLLSTLEAHPAVSELSGVPDAVVPIIKMKYKSVEVDLTFARLNLTSISSSMDNLNDQNLLKHLDEKTVRSLNGTRVADRLLSLVSNPETYRSTLRFIRHWAKRRGLYSNAVGFFGGITWAILTARICQMFPRFLPLQLVRKFFIIFSRWNWSNPVTLCPIETSDEVGLMGFKIWNPRLYTSDRFHLMPIITPAFPCMNSTYNVTETTKRLITSELRRAVDIADLTLLVRTPPFLSLFPWYFVVEASGEDQPVYTKLKGFVESRLRLLIKSLEGVCSIGFLRPWPGDFPKGPTACQWLIGMSFREDQSNAVCDLRPAISSFHDKLNEWTERDKMDGKYTIGLFHVRAASLSLEGDGLRDARVEAVVRERSRSDAPVSWAAGEEARPKKRRVEIEVE